MVLALLLPSYVLSAGKPGNNPSFCHTIASEIAENVERELDWLELPLSHYYLAISDQMKFSSAY